MPPVEKKQTALAPSARPPLALVRSAIDEIPIGQEAAALEAVHARAVAHFEKNLREIVVETIDSVAALAMEGRTAEVRALFGKPNKRFLRAAALLRRQSEDEFEAALGKLEALPPIDGFSAAKLRRAIDIVDRRLGDFAAEMEKDIRAAEPAAVRRERSDMERQARAARTQVRAYGYAPGLAGAPSRYFYTSSEKPGMTCLSPREHLKLSLLDLADLEYWKLHHGEVDNLGEKKLDWDAIAARLMSEGRQRGIVDPDKLRGRGAWLEPDGTFVFNTGSDLLYEGGFRCPLVDVESSVGHIYASGVEIHLSDDILDKSERRAIVEILATFKWENSSHRLMVQGWLLMATIVGALPWQAAIWLTAPADSGKSTLLEFIAALLGHATHFVKGSSTVRGVAQTVGFDSVPFLFEEGETRTEDARVRMGKLLEEMRSAVSKSSAKRVVNGSTTFLRSTGFIVSIADTLDDTADLQRFLRPKLQKMIFRTDEEKAAADASHKRILAETTSEKSARFLAFGIQNFRAIIETIDVFERHFAKLFDSRRDKRHFATAFGCAFFLEFARVPELAEVATWCASHDITPVSLVDADAKRDEKDKVLEVLLAGKIQMIDGGNAQRNYSNADLLSAAIRPGSIGERIDRQEALKNLEKNGLKVDLANGRLLVGRTHMRLRALFEQTSFGKNFVDALSPLVDEDDKPFKRTANFAGAGKHAVLPIKLAKIEPILGLRPIGIDVGDRVAAKLLDQLLVSRIPFENIDRRPALGRVRDLIDAYMEGNSALNVAASDARRALASVGILVEVEFSTLVIAIDHPELSKLLARGGNAFGKNYAKTLAPLVLETRTDALFGGVPMDAIVLADPKAEIQV